jgi:subtilisin family serine protease
MFSNRFNKFAQVAIVACASIALAGCQDAVAPVAPEVSSSIPLVKASRQTAPGRNVIKDQYIVVFRDGYSSDVDGRSKKLVAKTKGKLKHTFKAGLRGFVANITAEEAAGLSTDPNVKYVEQDQEITLGVGKPVKSGGGGKGGKGGKTTATPPVDSGVTVQTSVPSWGLDRVDQTLIPMDGNYAYDATGAGVNVYIIDSGIRITHSEFGGRATADYSIIDDGYGAIGCNWHGTHVAGIVGGETAGVAKDVLLHSVRILDCNAAGSVSGAVEGIDWVIANQVAPAVINLSVAASSSQVLTDAVDRAIAAGITVVVAAGNNAADACNFSPANATAAITVGATNSGDQQADFSNFGSCVDLMAPGDAIMSASSSDDTSLQYGSGTSMAAPYVAGTAALYLEKDPAADPATVTSTILQGSTGGLIGGLGLGTPNLLIRTR